MIKKKKNNLLFIVFKRIIDNTDNVIIDKILFISKSPNFIIDIDKVRINKGNK